MTVPARLSISEYERLNHRDVSLGGNRIHYVDEGEGFPLVLVHGSPTTSALWRHQPLGTHDAYFRNEHVELRTLLPGSRLVTLEGGGHFPQEDAPDAVTRELNVFLTTME